MAVYLKHSRYELIHTTINNKFKPKNILALIQSTSVIGWCSTQNLFHISREKRPT